jgi:hypothetical protein
MFKFGEILCKVEEICLKCGCNGHKGTKNTKFHQGIQINLLSEKDSLKWDEIKRPAIRPAFSNKYLQ